MLYDMIQFDDFVVIVLWGSRWWGSLKRGVLEHAFSKHACLICLEPPFQLPLLLPRFDEVYARSYCFSAHYIYHLLVNGYRFTEETWPQIYFKKEVSQGTGCFLPLLSKGLWADVRKKCRIYRGRGDFSWLKGSWGDFGPSWAKKRQRRTQRRCHWRPFQTRQRSGARCPRTLSSASAGLVSFFSYSYHSARDWEPRCLLNVWQVYK